MALACGSNDGLDFLWVQAFGAEVCVQFHQHFLGADVVGLLFGRVPPPGPLQDLSQRLANAIGQAAEDAVLAALAKFDGLGGFLPRR